MAVIDDLKRWKLQCPSNKARLPAHLERAVDELNIPGFNTRAEKLYAIFNDLSVRPVCQVCNGPVIFRSVFPKTCSLKCAARDPARTTKIASTSMERYGVDHPSKTEEFQAKVKSTNLERYGVEHVSQVPKIKHKLAQTNIARYGNKCTLNSPENTIKKKLTWLEKYGTDNPAKVPDVKNKILATQTINYQLAKQIRLQALLEEHGIKALFDNWINSSTEYPWEHIHCGTQFYYHFVSNIVPRCPICYPRNTSCEERAIQELLRRNNIAFVANTRSIIPPRELDIYIPSMNLAIEVNGAYWHHDAGTLLPLHEKTKLAANVGVQVLHFWDFEIREKFEIVSNIILAKLKLHPKIYARKLQVESISSQDAAVFLNAHHLAGFARATIYLALKDGDEIKAVASFAANRFKKDGTWELVRFATMKTIVGGLSKLIAKFKTMITAPLVSFADARFSIGDAYIKLGFKANGLTKPNYFYVRGNRRLYRQQAMKHKLQALLEHYDATQSEHQNMTNNGWFRCLDCGSYKFTLERQV